MTKVRTKSHSTATIAGDVPSTKPTPMTETEQVETCANFSIEQRTECIVEALSRADRTTVNKIIRLLAEHLGSDEAARLWLSTPSPSFAATPIDAIRDGYAKQVLAAVEGQWGNTPSYA